MNLDETIDRLKTVKEQIKDLNTEVKELKEREDEITRDLMAKMAEAGLKRMANDNATISVATELVPNADNWDEVYGFIIENKLLEFLHRRLSATAIREYVSTYGDIPGLSMRELTKLNFRSL
jgi:hypothetical protein